MVGKKKQQISVYTFLTSVWKQNCAEFTIKFYKCTYSVGKFM